MQLCGHYAEITATELKALFVYCRQNPDLVCTVLLNLMWQGHTRNSKASQSTEEQHNSDLLGLGWLVSLLHINRPITLNLRFVVPLNLKYSVTKQLFPVGLNLLHRMHNSSKKYLKVWKLKIDEKPCHDWALGRTSCSILRSIIPNHLNQVFSNYEAPLDHPHLIRMYL